jgi:serine/threonine protein kinase
VVRDLQKSPLPFLTGSKEESQKTFGVYKILKKLGQGGMAVVYLAEHLALGNKVAIKVLQNPFEGSRLVDRFFLEARSMAKIKHPNVIRVQDIGTENDCYYYVMEYIEGEDLDSILRREGVLYWRHASCLIRQAALGLQAAHEQGILHRDIKPSNLMLSQEKELKVTDFGLAREIDHQSSLSSPGQMLGTPEFMSPEQCRSEPLDFRTDIYSLGITFYCLITGERPCASENLIGVLSKHLYETPPLPSTIIADIPQALDLLISQMIEKNPQDRPESMQELITRIEQLLERSEPHYSLENETKETFHTLLNPLQKRSSSPPPLHPPSSKTQASPVNLSTTVIAPPSTKNRLSPLAPKSTPPSSLGNQKPKVQGRSSSPSPVRKSGIKLAITVQDPKKHVFKLLMLAPLLILISLFFLKLFLGSSSSSSTSSTELGELQKTYISALEAVQNPQNTPREVLLALEKVLRALPPEAELALKTQDSLKNYFSLLRESAAQALKECLKSSSFLRKLEEKNFKEAVIQLEKEEAQSELAFLVQEKNLFLPQTQESILRHTEWIHLLYQKEKEHLKREEEAYKSLATELSTSPPEEESPALKEPKRPLQTETLSLEKIQKLLQEGKVLEAFEQAHSLKDKEGVALVRQKAFEAFQEEIQQNRFSPNRFKAFQDWKDQEILLETSYQALLGEIRYQMENFVKNQDYPSAFQYAQYLPDSATRLEDLQQKLKSFFENAILRSLHSAESEGFLQDPRFREFLEEEAQEKLYQIHYEKYYRSLPQSFFPARFYQKVFWDSFFLALFEKEYPQALMVLEGHRFAEKHSLKQQEEYQEALGSLKLLQAFEFAFKQGLQTEKNFPFTLEKSLKKALKIPDSGKRSAFTQEERHFLWLSLKPEEILQTFDSYSNSSTPDPQVLAGRLSFEHLMIPSKREDLFSSDSFSPEILNFLEFFQKKMKLYFPAKEYKPLLLTKEEEWVLALDQLEEIYPQLQDKGLKLWPYSSKTQVSWSPKGFQIRPQESSHPLNLDLYKANSQQVRVQFQISFEKLPEYFLIELQGIPYSYWLLWSGKSFQWIRRTFEGKVLRESVAFLPFLEKQRSFPLAQSRLYGRVPYLLKEDEEYSLEIEKNSYSLQVSLKTSEKQQTLFYLKEEPSFEFHFLAFSGDNDSQYFIKKLKVWALESPSKREELLSYGKMLSNKDFLVLDTKKSLDLQLLLEQKQQKEYWKKTGDILQKVSKLQGKKLSLEEQEKLPPLHFQTDLEKDQPQWPVNQFYSKMLFSEVAPYPLEFSFRRQIPTQEIYDFYGKVWILNKYLVVLDGQDLLRLLPLNLVFQKFSLEVFYSGTLLGIQIPKNPPVLLQLAFEKQLYALPEQFLFELNPGPKGKIHGIEFYLTQVKEEDDKEEEKED